MLTMHKNIAVLDTFAAQHNKINTQTEYFISCAPLNSDVIGVCTMTLTVSICDP